MLYINIKRRLIYNKMEIKNINFNDLYISDINVRKTLTSDEDETGINDLASDIKVNGLINPLTVRYNGDNKYEVIAGQRRYLALQTLNHTLIPCNILDVDDQKAEEISLVENVQRNQMTTFDKVKSYSKLYEVYDKNIDKVISAIHISKQTLQKYLKISKLPDNIILLLDTSDVDNKISLDVAVNLSKLPNSINACEVLEKIKTLKNDQKINAIKTLINTNCDISELQNIAENIIIQSNNIKLAPSFPYVEDPNTNKNVRIPNFLYSNIINLIKEKTGHIEYID